MTRFVHHSPLRWSDMDAYGHVNNARFLTLYEEARVALLFVEARKAGVTSFERGVVISRHEVDYLRPVDYALGRATAEAAPTVRIELWVEEIRASRFTVAYELYDGDLLASTARSVLVPFDLMAKRPRRITSDERAFLLAYAPAGGPA
jgi:acyl-CoA thioester hydrolase